MASCKQWRLFIRDDSALNNRTNLNTDQVCLALLIVFNLYFKYRNAGFGGVKEAIYVKREKPSLNQRGGLRVHLSPSNNGVIAAFPQLSVNGTDGYYETVMTSCIFIIMKQL